MPDEAHVRRAPGFFWPCFTLVEREIVRFLRQRSRIIGALGTPLVFWFLAGGGIGRSFSAGGSGPAVSYLEYTFPGALAAIVLFTSIFSMITIIDDRQAGFMQGVLVAPVSRLAIVLGKIVGASILAVGQAMLFFLLGPIAGVHLGAGMVLCTFGAMLLVALALCGLGFCFAWATESAQGFHAVMNLVLMPMLIMSGAFFPPSGSVLLLRVITYLNPMTYAVALLRHTVYLGRSEQVPSVVGLWESLAITGAFAVIMLALSIFFASRQSSKALQ